MVTQMSKARTVYPPRPTISEVASAITNALPRPALSGKELKTVAKAVHELYRTWPGDIRNHKESGQ
jgi:hypothetical protein